MQTAADKVPFHEPNPGGERQGQKLGERLRARGLITEQQLQQALEVQRRSGVFLGQILVDLGSMSARDMGELLASGMGVAYVDLGEERPNPEAVALVPEHLIREHRCIPLRVRTNLLDLAMVDPLDINAIDAIHAVTRLRVVPSLTMMSELVRTINDFFDAHTRTSEALQDLEAAEVEDSGLRRSRADLVVASEAPIVRLVDSLLESAVALRASDVHFEPHEHGLRVRFRVDGTMLEQTDIPRSQQNAVTARVKVLCLMDITESRRPQDGRMRYTDHGRAYDLRVSSVPTVFGEKIVLRILDKSSVLVPLSRLGFLPEQGQQFEALIRRPHGMVLVVGPTGSGKSTTLYSALNLLNDSTRNIMTLEDPVEYNVKGLNQVQVNARIDLTFANGLRAFVRQDPDVILVGEIRDRETAEMAVQASLTGHLVLTTLHTNSAVGTIARLMNLGVDPFLIAQSITGVVSQRLVARICTHCARDHSPSQEMLGAIGINPQEAHGIRFKRGTGCRTCRGRGYLGRWGIYEVLVIGEEVSRLIMRGSSDPELEAAAVRNGMVTLRESALMAVRSGITTPEEMGRATLAREAEGRYAAAA